MSGKCYLVRGGVSPLEQLSPLRIASQNLVGVNSGNLVYQYGVMRVLMLGAVLSAGSNLLFAWLGTRGHDVNALIFVISADNLSSGIASAAFIAYLSSLTNVNYSATQYALFSSMMLLLPKFLAGYSGKYVDAFGYSHFFIATALLGLPVAPHAAAQTGRHIALIDRQRVRRAERQRDGGDR
jgi:MFS family permease